MRPWLTCVAISLASTSNAEARASIDARDLWSPTVAVTSDEQRLLDDALDGRWDQHTLFAAALVASGADQQQQAQATLNYERLKAAIAQSIPTQEAPRNRAAALLRFLHHGVLRGGYDLRATAIHDCLAGGRFNCVSATVLFNCLAAEIGLQVQTLGYPNHARSVVIADGRAIEVETTCADWFYRPQDDAAQDSRAANLATVAHGDSATAHRRCSRGDDLLQPSRRGLARTRLSGRHPPQPPGALRSIRPTRLREQTCIRQLITMRSRPVMPNNLNRRSP